jgi:hypothetical protein
VTVKLASPSKSITTLAYLDTGASFSVFNSEYCERLGLVLLSGKRVDIMVGDGGLIPVYLHELDIQIEDIKFKAKIGFSDRLGTGINILGREGVMDEFVICFDGKKKETLWKTK